MKSINQTCKEFHSKKGFTLVELLVVVSIIAIMSVVAYTAVGGNQVTARNAKRKQDINSIQSALQSFYFTNAAYPTDLTTANLTKKYLSKQLLDPKTGVGYSYKVSGSTYELAATLEADGTALMQAYLVGNSETPLFTGLGKTVTSCIAGTAVSCGVAAEIIDGGACVPYCTP